MIKVSDDGTLALWAEVPPQSVHAAWAAWLRRHSINPADVIIPGGVHRLVDKRQVAYLTYMRDPETGRIVTKNGDLARIWRVVQLESPPAPFPQQAAPATQPTIPEDTP